MGRFGTLVYHLGYADDFIQVATSPKDIQKMYSDLERTWSPKGLRSNPGKLQPSSDLNETPVRVGGHTLNKVEASVNFLGAPI